MDPIRPGGLAEPYCRQFSAINRAAQRLDAHGELLGSLRDRQ